MKTKICTKCKIEKELSAFHCIKSKNKHRADCKECHSEIVKRYNSTHKKQRQLYYNEYSKNNSNKISVYQKKYKKEHSDILHEKQRQNRKTKKFKQHRREYRLNKYQNNIEYRLLELLRNRIYYTITHESKSQSTMILLGCSIEYLKNHLQSQFKQNMTWDNHGTGHNGKGMKEWHIDHIRPCASFDLSKESEQRKCFHYTNLQPLWAKENLIKKDS